ncbi:hypothetical protein Tco_1016574 [Tanacetum coccineum]|uniref:Uncharacterized protein n=1 Tax=Tanacetum coccineum TaxID=301880 RepID=A0ABQ5FPM9_9ASTR
MGWGWGWGWSLKEEPHHNERPTLQRLPFYCIVAATPGFVIPGPILDELVATVPDTKVLAKDEKSKKRKSSTSGTASSQVAKRTMSTMAHDLFDGSSDDEVHYVDEQDDGQDDDCVEIPLITPIMSDVKLPFGGNQGGERSAPFVVDTPSEYVGRPQDFVGVDPSNVGPSFVAPTTVGDDIERDLYPFILGHTYVDYPKEGLIEVFKYPNVCKAVVDQFPTHKLSVLHCVMMSHGGELLLSSINGLNSQIYDLKEQVGTLNEKAEASETFIAEAAQLTSDLTDARRAEAHKRLGKVRKFLGSDEFSRVRREIISLALNVGFARGLRMDRNEEQLVEAMIKIFNFVLGSQGKLIEATPLVATAEYPYPSKVVDHSNDPLSSLISLERDRSWPPRTFLLDASVDKHVEVVVDGAILEVYLEAPSSVVVALTTEKEGEYATSVSQHAVVVPNDSHAIFENDHTLREV